MYVILLHWNHFYLHLIALKLYSGNGWLYAKNCLKIKKDSFLNHMPKNKISTESVIVGADKNEANASIRGRITITAKYHTTSDISLMQRMFKHILPYLANTKTNMKRRWRRIKESSTAFNSVIHVLYGCVRSEHIYIHVLRSKNHICNTYKSFDQNEHSIHLCDSESHTVFSIQTYRIEWKAKCASNMYPTTQ